MIDPILVINKVRLNSRFDISSLGSSIDSILILEKLHPKLANRALDDLVKRYFSHWRPIIETYHSDDTPSHPRCLDLNIKIDWGMDECRWGLHEIDAGWWRKGRVWLCFRWRSDGVLCGGGRGESRLWAWKFLIWNALLRASEHGRASYTLFIFDTLSTGWEDESYYYYEEELSVTAFYQVRNIISWAMRCSLSSKGTLWGLAISIFGEKHHWGGLISPPTSLYGPCSSGHRFYA